MIYRLMLIFMVLSMAGCAGLSRQQLPPERPLPEAAVVPVESQQLGNPLQVMLQIDAPNRDALDLQKELIAHYQSLFLRNGVVLNNLSDRDRRKLDEEIQRAIIHSGKEYYGQQSVDYYLRGSLLESTFTEEYSAPVWCPFCEDNRPGTCEYEQRAGLFLEVYELPSNQRVKSWRVSDETSESFDAQNSCHRAADDTNPKALYAEMRKDILDTLKNCISDSVARYLSPEAYIARYYSDGEKHYFEITGGSGAGFRKGDTVQLLRIAPMTQGGGATLLGEAEVTGLVEPRRAVIQVTDKKLVNEIRRFDKVKASRGSDSMGFGCIGHVEEI
ncbi:MAG: hypothetical protein H6999_05670 [Hahellaceae bacterium]|nr:hypothetical protein [Hahellaceae bacterium]MCP5169227.1 hypothetical protein [Hahellaceae bacterium]